MSVYDDLLRRLGGVGGLGPEGLHGMSSGEMERQLRLQQSLAQAQQRNDGLREAMARQQQGMTVLEAAARGLPNSECCVHGWYRPTCPMCADGMRQGQTVDTARPDGVKPLRREPKEQPVEFPGPPVPHPIPPGRGFYAADLIPLGSLFVAGVLALLMVL